MVIDQRARTVIWLFLVIYPTDRVLCKERLKLRHQATKPLRMFKLHNFLLLYETFRVPNSSRSPSLWGVDDNSVPRGLRMKTSSEDEIIIIYHSISSNIPFLWKLEERLTRENKLIWKLQLCGEENDFSMEISNAAQYGSSFIWFSGHSDGWIMKTWIAVSFLWRSPVNDVLVHEFRSTFRSQIQEGTK